MREFGIGIMMPGFFGLVPLDFKEKFPESNPVEQGSWCDAFLRQPLLTDTDPMFEKTADAFYKKTSIIFKFSPTTPSPEYMFQSESVTVSDIETRRRQRDTGGEMQLVGTFVESESEGDNITYRFPRSYGSFGEIKSIISRREYILPLFL